MSRESPALSQISLGYFHQRTFLKRAFYSDFRVNQKKENKLKKVKRKLIFIDTIKKNQKTNEKIDFENFSFGGKGIEIF